MNLYPLIAVVGPTGSGKSELALRLAAEFGGEVVNCDSVQVYAGLDIGSAKTPVSERCRIPHHLLDVIAPEGEMTAGDYARAATTVLAEIRERQHLPLLVGGTGFYLRALLDGLSPAPTRNAELRDRLTRVAAQRPGALHRFLRRDSPETAERIHANDHQKLIRAIEMAGQIRGPRQRLQGYRVLKISLVPERAALYERLDRRCERMFADGLMDETAGLLASGVPANAKALTTLGYKQAVAVLRDGLPLDEAVAECQLKTRHYAKRQVTWFRAEKDVARVQGFGGDERVREEVRGLVRAHLEGSLS